MPEKAEDGKRKDIQEEGRDSSVARLLPPPNTPCYAKDESTPTCQRKAPMISRDNEKVVKVVCLERPQTVATSRSRVQVGDDDIIERAKSQLGTELRDDGKPPSSTKLREKRVKMKMHPHVPPVRDEKQMMLDGLKMRVAQDPAK